MSHIDQSAFRRIADSLPTPTASIAPKVEGEAHPNCPNQFVCAGRCSGDRCADAMEPVREAAPVAQVSPRPESDADRASGGVE